MKTKMFLLVSCCLFFLAAISVVAEEEKKAEPVKEAATKARNAPSAQPKQPQGTPLALTVEAIQELEERKKLLDAREAELSERAKALEMQEKLLKEKLQKMEDLNARMAQKLDVFKKEHEAKVTKLVTVVETMKPQAAAEYIENLDPELAVAILTRIQVQKAAKILNLVNKAKSARLTELYTGYRDSIPGTEVQPSTNLGKEPQTAGKM